MLEDTPFIETGSRDPVKNEFVPCGQGQCPRTRLYGGANNGD